MSRQRAVPGRLPGTALCLLFLLSHVEHWYLGDCPAIIRAGNLKLHHGYSISGAAHNTQAAADTLLLVDDHIGTAYPGRLRYF